MGKFICVFVSFCHTELYCCKNSEVVVHTYKHNSCNSYVTTEGPVATLAATSKAMESHGNSMCVFEGHFYAEASAV